MKIYDYKGFPNPARIRIALAEKGLTHAVEFVTVDVPAGEHKAPNSSPGIRPAQSRCSSSRTAFTSPNVRRSPSTSIISIASRS